MGYKSIINQLIEGKNIESEEIKEIISQILEESLDPVQSSAFLTALRIKGESEEEILGVANALREKMIKVRCKEREKLADTCGTGGDGSGTFNISTTVAFIAAAAGFKVAKHGNRSVTSSSGSADLLVSLGVNITNLTPTRAEEALRKIGVTFLFAPFFHPAMKAVAPIRQGLGFRTIFNIIGPLVNPAGPVMYHTLGVFSPKYVEVVARVLRKLGTEKGAVFSSYDGLDEVSPFEATKVVLFDRDNFQEFIIRPEDFDMKHNRRAIDEIKVSDPEESAKLVKDILTGSAPKVAVDIVLLNAGLLFALRNGGKIAEGIEEARAILSSLKPLEKLNQLVGFTQKEEMIR